MPTKPLVPPDQDARDRILRDLDTCLLVEAAAGTGKTTSMVGRMVALLVEGKCEVSEIAAITFTKKAAAELRDRFQIELFRKARESEGVVHERLAQAAANIDRGFVGTIHSFCARLLRERPVEAGVDVAFEELDDAEDKLLRKRAWDEYVAVLFSERSPMLDRLRCRGLSIDHLQGGFLKLADYPDVAEWPAPEIDPPDFKDLVRKIREFAAHMSEVTSQFVDPGVTDELIEEYLLIPKLTHVLDLTSPVDVMRLVGRFRGSVKSAQKNWIQITENAFDRSRAKEEIERWAQFVEQTAEPALSKWRESLYPTALEAVRSALIHYDDLRRRAGRLNYQDLLMKAAALLRDHPEVRGYLRNRFKRLLVDEFQDTDPVQAEVMLFLTGEDPGEKDWTACKPVPGSLFVVGDPKQSIYRFRRADIVTYNQVKEILQQSGGEVVTLSTNFRTLEPITAWVNDLFEDPFNTADRKHSPAYVALQPGRNENSPGLWPSLAKMTVEGEGRSSAPLLEADSDRIARTIRWAIDCEAPIPRTATELARGVSPTAQPGDFMILTRTKKRLSLYARKLQEYGIPHLVSGGGGVGEIEEVLLLKNCIAALARPDNPVALVALLRGPLFGFDEDSLFEFHSQGGKFDYRSNVPEGLDPSSANRFRDLFRRLHEYVGWFERLPLLSAVERTAEDLALTLRCLSGEEGDLSAGSFLKALEYLRTHRSTMVTLSDLLEVLETLLEGADELDGIPAYHNPASVVRLMNLHKAKGLEAPVVFLADPSPPKGQKPEIYIDRSDEGARGYLLIQERRPSPLPSILLAEPHQWASWSEEEKRFLDAEEKRLLYVAATRAGAHLFVSHKAVKKSGDPPSEAWGFFREALQDHPELPDPGPVTPTIVRGEPLTCEESEIFRDSNLGRWRNAKRVSYRVEAAKQVDKERLPFRPTDSDGGMNWGSLIHLLLETAMKDPHADLESLAKSVIEKEELDPNLIEPSLEVVERVRKSPIWERSEKSERRFIEIPFQTLKEGGEGEIPTQIKGIVDLIFREPNGWVLVDYKTDRVSEPAAIEALIETYRPQLANYEEAWNRLTQEPVVEKCLYLTHCDRLVPVTD